MGESTRMRVLHAATEAFPYVKVGGLSDVMGSLPAALCEIGLDARLLLPGYPGVLGGVGDLSPMRTITTLRSSAEARLLVGTTDRGVPLYVLDAPSLFGRSQDPYADFGDSHLVSAALATAAADLAANGDARGFRPDVLNCHDRQTALAPPPL